jgi:AhpD family alkylhydroperoxidase
MAVVPLLDDRQAPLTAQAYYADGDPGPLVAAFAHVPELLDAVMPFLGTIFGPSSLSLRAKEMVVLRTSALQRCRYCVETHTVVSRDAGLSLLEVAGLRGEGSTSAFRDPGDLALLEWVDLVGGSSLAPDAATTEGMQHHFSDAALVELTALVGATLMLNRFATSLQLPTSDETLARLGDEGFATGVDVGP